MKDLQILSAFADLPASGAAEPARALVFDACHVGVILRAVLFVESVVGVAAMFVADGFMPWLARVSVLSGAALPAVLVWLLVGCSFKRWLARLALARPFKPQNMSNNAAVTADGGEIGRAQALQARAARTPASVHMNPVLLKPQSEVGAQIVVQGRVHATAKAAAYQRLKPDLMPFVLDSYERLKREADIVLVEGAGSASEVNLRGNDIANMGFARTANVPVVLVGDIERGGVIASLVGTKLVIDPSDAAMIVGFLVNKFRGDPTC